MEMGSTLRAGSRGVQVDTVHGNEVGTMASKRPNQPKPHVTECPQPSHRDLRCLTQLSNGKAMLGPTTPPWERRPQISRCRFYMGEPRSRLRHFHFMCIVVSKSPVAAESVYLGFWSINVRITSPTSMMLVRFGMHLSNQKDAWATVRIKNKHLSSFCSQSLSHSRAV